jgi:hypothetical protein
MARTDPIINRDTMLGSRSGLAQLLVSDFLDDEFSSLFAKFKQRSAPWCVDQTGLHHQSRYTYRHPTSIGCFIVIRSLGKSQSDCNYHALPRPRVKDKQTKIPCTWESTRVPSGSALTSRPFLGLLSYCIGYPMSSITLCEIIDCFCIV